jgi:hypothetical protein
MHPDVMGKLLREGNPVPVLVDALVIASHLARVAKEGARARAHTHDSHANLGAARSTRTHASTTTNNNTTHTSCPACRVADQRRDRAGGPHAAAAAAAGACRRGRARARVQPRGQHVPPQRCVRRRAPPALTAR